MLINEGKLWLDIVCVYMMFYVFLVGNWKLVINFISFIKFFIRKVDFYESFLILNLSFCDIISLVFVNVLYMERVFICDLSGNNFYGILLFFFEDFLFLMYFDVFLNNLIGSFLVGI